MLTGTSMEGTARETDFTCVNAAAFATDFEIFEFVLDLFTHFLTKTLSDQSLRSPSK